VDIHNCQAAVRGILTSDIRLVVQSLRNVAEDTVLISGKRSIITPYQDNSDERKTPGPAEDGEFAAPRPLPQLRADSAPYSAEIS
jgi:hypothetical protein